MLMLFFETMPVKLHGRFHPDPKTLRRWSTLRVMDPVGVKGGRGQGLLAKFMASIVYDAEGFQKFQRFQDVRFFELKAPGVKEFKACGNIS